MYNDRIPNLKKIKNPRSYILGKWLRGRNIAIDFNLLYIIDGFCSDLLKTYTL